MFGLHNKGHLAEGADADITILDLSRGEASMSLANGRVIMINGILTSYYTSKYRVSPVKGAIDTLLCIVMPVSFYVLAPIDIFVLPLDMRLFLCYR